MHAPYTFKPLEGQEQRVGYVGRVSAALAGRAGKRGGYVGRVSAAVTSAE